MDFASGNDALHGPHNVLQAVVYQNPSRSDRNSHHQGRLWGSGAARKCITRRHSPKTLLQRAPFQHTAVVFPLAGSGSICKHLSDKLSVCSQTVVPPPPRSLAWVVRELAAANSQTHLPARTSPAAGLMDGSFWKTRSNFAQQRQCPSVSVFRRP